MYVFILLCMYFIGLSSHHSQNVNFCINGNLTNDKRIIANGFNMFFTTVGFILANKIDDSINPLSYVNGTMNSIVIPEITQAQVRRVVKSFKCSAPGWYGLPASVGKQCIDSFNEPLTILINMSFAEGIFPDELKLARVVPIYKSGDKKEVSNDRPLSVLSFYSKIFEKIMYEYVVEFMDKDDIIFKNQFGFRKNHST